MSPEASRTPNLPHSNLEKNRRVDRRVTIDMQDSLGDLYPDPSISNDKFVGDVVAEIETGDAEKDGRLVAVVRGEARNGRPAVVTIEGENVTELKVGQYTDLNGFRVRVEPDLTHLLLDNPDQGDVRVTAHVVRGAEPFARGY